MAQCAGTMQGREVKLDERLLYMQGRQMTALYYGFNHRTHPLYVIESLSETSVAHHEGQP